MNYIRYAWAWVRLQCHCLYELFKIPIGLEFLCCHRENKLRITLYPREEPSVSEVALKCECGKVFYKSEGYDAIEARFHEEV